jgi:predicted nucleic acid-binding protein
MIISDATVIITLINIDRLNILQLFTNKIYITQEVYEEVACRVYAKVILDEYIKNQFIEKRDATNRQIYNEFRYILDDGEASSIALAMEMGLPLIIDEKKGRRFAQRQGVEIIGLIGILRFLYIEGTLSKEEAEEIIKRLNSTNFRISSSLIDMILA